VHQEVTEPGHLTFTSVIHVAEAGHMLQEGTEAGRQLVAVVFSNLCGGGWSPTGIAITSEASGIVRSGAWSSTP
jgi:hypothetical protein